MLILPYNTNNTLVPRLFRYGGLEVYFTPERRTARKKIAQQTQPTAKFYCHRPARTVPRRPSRHKPPSAPIQTRKHLSDKVDFPKIRKSASNWPGSCPPSCRTAPIINLVPVHRTRLISLPANPSKRPPWATPFSTHRGPMAMWAAWNPIAFIISNNRTTSNFSRV